MVTALGTPVLMSQITLKAANIATGRYVYTEDLLRLEECTDINHPISCPSCPSLSSWMEFVLAHPDHRFASYIYSGLSTGFRIGFYRQASTLQSTARNHPSASKNMVVVPI